MKVQTFSVVVGGKNCNASCPYCVSKITGDEGLCEEINWRNFHKACQFAKQSGVSTVLLTGKGEPLLYPDLITKYLNILERYRFPFIELQTNGIELPFLGSDLLRKWYDTGLTTVSLSCAHYNSFRNKEIFGDNYGKMDYDLFDYVSLLHVNNFSVRVSCVMCKGYIDNLKDVKFFIDLCKKWEVEQFTIRPVAMIEDKGKNPEIMDWIQRHYIDYDDKDEIEKYFRNNGYLLLELAHGAKVYDYKGQNISINTCLTHTPDPDDIRQLIFFPDGRLRYDWVKTGAIII